MYNILLVDDELPALRFLETIITKYTDSYEVINKMRDGKSALEWIEEHTSDIDVLITDIRMPDMDGITLAKAARALVPALHIVIVSGYQEFEYAHGAIEASVDDYLLKPVSVTHMKELLEKIKIQLDTIKKSNLTNELVNLLTSKDYNKKIIEKQYGSGNYYYALIRFGNAPYHPNNLHKTDLADNTLFTCENPDTRVITGKDEKEFLVYSPSKGAITSFRLSVRKMAESLNEPYTIISAQTGMDIYSFGTFYQDAAKMLRRRIVIGFSTDSILSDDALTKLAADQKSTHLAATTLRQLEYCVNDMDMKSLREIFKNLGNEWDSNHYTQRQVYVLIQQILHLVQSVRLDHIKSTDQIMLEADQLTEYVKNYSELTEKLFLILFEGTKIDIQKMSPEDMYNYAMNSIRENFSQPISIQTVCSEIGISQTYLSRLFRKFGDTSFNAQLVKCRIENACQLMKAQPQTPLNQIAACVGYEDYAYFSKVFRQVVGCSPSQYNSHC